MTSYVPAKDDDIGDDDGKSRTGMDNILMECMDDNDRRLVLLLLPH